METENLVPVQISSPKLQQLEIILITAPSSLSLLASCILLLLSQTFIYPQMQMLPQQTLLKMCNMSGVMECRR